jgi:hypothetical protein
MLVEYPCGSGARSHEPGRALRHSPRDGGERRFPFAPFSRSGSGPGQPGLPPCTRLFYRVAVCAASVEASEIASHEASPSGWALARGPELER